MTRNACPKVDILCSSAMTVLKLLETKCFTGWTARRQRKDQVAISIVDGDEKKRAPELSPATPAELSVMLCLNSHPFRRAHEQH